MIHWHWLFIPTSGMVLCWLLAGLATLLWIALTPNSSYRRMIPKETVLFGLLSTLVTVAVWPLVWLVRWYYAVPRRDVQIYRAVIQLDDIITRAVTRGRK